MNTQFNHLHFKTQKSPETITFLEAVRRAFGSEMRQVWAHYLSQRGTPRSLSSFNLGTQFRRHRNVRSAVKDIKVKAQSEIEKKIIKTCAQNKGKDIRVTGFFHTAYATVPINVVDDPKLSLVGRGTLSFSVIANVEHNCTTSVYSATGRVAIELIDAFIDVRDLSSTKPGNQELGGKGFRLSERWSEGFQISRAKF